MSNAQDARTEPLRAPLSPEDQAAFDAWHAQYERNKAELAQVSVDAADAADAADDPWRGCAVDVTEQYLPSPAVALSDSGNGGNGTNPRGEVYAVQCPRFIGDHTVTILAGDEPCSRCGKGATAHNIDRDTPRGFYAHFAVWEQENPCPSEDDIEDLPRWLEKRAQFERDIAARGFNRPEQSKRNRGKSKPEPIEATTGNGECALTDSGNAQRLARDHGETFRYCAEWNTWIVYENGRWQRDITGKVYERALSTVRNIPCEVTAEDPEWTAYTKHALKSQGTKALKAMVENAGLTIPAMKITALAMDSDPWLLNVKNGTLNLRTLELKPHDPRDLITRMCGASWVPEARSDVWERFLMDAFKPLESQCVPTVECIQRLIGYSLTGDTSVDVVAFLHGEGGSGKSTLLEAVGAMMGDYATAIDFETLMERKRSGDTNSSLAALPGIRFLRASEPDKGGRIDTKRLKSYSGADLIRCRDLYSRAFTFKPQFKLVCAMNDRPSIDGADSGVERRLHCFPFLNGAKQRGGEDNSIRTTLINPDVSGSAILAWAAEGLRKFLSDGGGIAGLKIPQAVKDSTEEYRRDNDPLSDFVSDRITFNTNARVARNVLLEAYKAFARESAVNDREFALQVRKLITRTHGASFAAEKKTGGNRFWCGIGLIAPSEERD